jgi:hypothetical protein
LGVRPPRRVLCCHVVVVAGRSTDHLGRDHHSPWGRGRRRRRVRGQCLRANSRRRSNGGLTRHPPLVLEAPYAVALPLLARAGDRDRRRPRLRRLPRRLALRVRYRLNRRAV